MTREFVLLALKANTDGSFNLENLPSAGRIDLVCRCVSNALFISNAMRKNTIIHACLNGFPSSQSPKIVSFYGNSLRGMEWDELSIARFLQKALIAGRNLKLGEEKEVTPGLKVSKKAFETLIQEKAKKEEKKIFYLSEKGEDIRNKKFEGNEVFVVGDFVGFPKNTEKLLKRIGAEKIKVSPLTIMASHCIILVNNELDRREIL